MYKNERFFVKHPNNIYENFTLYDPNNNNLLNMKQMEQRELENLKQIEFVFIGVQNLNILLRKLMTSVTESISYTVGSDDVFEFMLPIHTKILKLDDKPGSVKNITKKNKKPSFLKEKKKMGLFMGGIVGGGVLIGIIIFIVHKKYKTRK